MQTLITPTNILFVLGILGTIFTVYNYFRNPQIQTEKNESDFRKDIAAIRSDFQDFKSVFDSHLAADIASFSMLNQHVVEVDKSVVKLTTIIDERIPKKS